MKDVEISVVATIYNSAGCISPLIQEIERNVQTLEIPYEIILVNDNSQDKSGEIIKDICSKATHIKGLLLSRNFGQQIAMSAGIAHAKGKYIVIMDGDLQNPPESIPLLYRKIKEGYDIVYTTSTVRNNNVDAVTSRLFWFLVTKLFKVDIVPNQLMLKIFTATIGERFVKYNEHKRVVADILRDTTANYAVMPVKNSRRYTGKSNYNLTKRMLLMFDFIFNITIKPLDWILGFGFFIFVSSVLFSIRTLYVYLAYRVPIGYTSSILTIVWFNSIIIMILGFIGKYVANIYHEIKDRPLYFVSTTYNI